MIIAAEFLLGREDPPVLNLLGDAEQVETLKKALISRALGAAATLKDRKKLTDLHTFINFIAADENRSVLPVSSEFMSAILSEEAVADREDILFESARRGTIPMQAYLDEVKLHHKVSMREVCFTSEGLFAETDGTFKPKIHEVTPGHLDDFDPSLQNLYRVLGATHYGAQSELVGQGAGGLSLRPQALEDTFEHLSIGVVDTSGDYRPRATILEDDHPLVGLADEYSSLSEERNGGPDVIRYGVSSPHVYGNRVNFIGIDNYFFHGRKAVALYGKSSAIGTATQ
ncbi:MAG TPA: hypothetical protein VF733_01025 [Candidatus Saccharimonadales bacterium]